MNHTSLEKIFSELQFLVKEYSLVRRAMTQPYTLELVRERNKDYVYDPADTLIQETLIEHVGSLPIIATALFPHLNDDRVDLGKTLTMLAIHDIGELVTGDENTYTKKQIVNPAERDAALELLHPMYHAFYDDIEFQNSPSAKFAKSIDKMTPDILNYLTTAEETTLRFKNLSHVEPENIIATIRNHKTPYMQWNPFLLELHNFMIKKLEQKLKNVAV